MVHLVRNIKKFLTIPALEKKLFFSGLAYCIYVSVLVYFFPLKFYKKILLPGNTGRYLVEEEQAFRLTGKTLRRITKILPWQASCLIKSLTFKHLLTQYFGLPAQIILEAVRNKDNQLTAHAWVMYNDSPVYLHRQHDRRVRLSF